MRLITPYLFVLLFCFTQTVFGQAFLSVKQQPKGERAALAIKIYHSTVADFPFDKGEKQIQSLIQFAEAENNLELQIQALKLLADFLALNYKEGTIKMFAVCKKGLTLSEKASLQRETVYFLQRISNYYLIKKKYPQAFEYILRAHAIIEKVGFYKSVDASDFLHDMAFVYFIIGKYNTSISYLKNALKYPAKTALNRIKTYNKLGLCYKLLDSANQALVYFRIALNYAQKSHNKAWEGIISGNIGGIYFDKGKLKLADHYFARDYRISKQQNQVQSASMALILRAKIDLLKNNTQAAIAKLDKIENAEKPLAYTNVCYKYFSTKADYYAKIGKYRMALIASDSAQGFKNKLDKSKKLLQLRKKEIELSTEQHLNSIKLLKTKQKSERLVRNSVIVAMGLALIILLLLVNRVLIRRRHDKKTFTLEKQHAEKELIASQKRLGTYMSAIRNKNTMLGELREEIKKLAISGKKSEKEKANMLDRLYTSKILTEDNWIEFKRLFNRVHPKFIGNIRHTFGSLSTAEIRYLALLKLDLSTTEMAQMLGISPESVRKTNFRLRRKLSLEAQEDLFESVKAL